MISMAAIASTFAMCIFARLPLVAAGCAAATAWRRKRWLLFRGLPVSIAPCIRCLHLCCVHGEQTMCGSLLRCVARSLLADYLTVMAFYQRALPAATYGLL